MKIGVSAFAGDGGKSGIGQYLINTLSRLPALAPQDQFVVFTTRSACTALRLDQSDLEIVAVPDWVETPVINILWHVLVFPLRLALYRCDAAYLPAGNRRLGWWYGVPSIGTVHDLAQLHVTDKYDGWRMFYARHVLPRMIRRLTRVISVSSATSKDLVSRIDIPGPKVRVVPNGFDRERFENVEKSTARRQISEKFAIDSPYLLYVARLEHPGKNHVRLLEAFAQLKEQGLKQKLVLAGSRWNGADVIEAAVNELGLDEDVIFTGFVDNDALPYLYAAADVFVFPSLFEGFGIPLLEAMMSGVPVCASDIASIPEVVGEASLLFDPREPAQIAKCIQEIVESNDLRRRLISTGRKRAATFSWEASAGRVLEVFRECLST
jgi:glycosyltransferase involved in cell wall biosynthesis